MHAPRWRHQGRHRARPLPRQRRSKPLVALSSATVLVGALAVAMSFPPSPSVGVGPTTAEVAANGPTTHNEDSLHAESLGDRAELDRLDARLSAVESATVMLVGPIPEVEAVPVLPRLRPDFVEAVAQPVVVGSTADQLPSRVQTARQKIHGGDVSDAAVDVKVVETDVLLVALDLADQSAQNAALARLLVAADPNVAALDAAVGATHSAADSRDVLQAALSATQARDAAAGITLAAQQAATTADDETKAAILEAQQQAHSTDGFTNGNIPIEVLCAVEFAPQHHLRCDAADALSRLNAAYRAAFGHDMVLTDSYRGYDDQVRTKAAKGGLAAVPGTSNHGWGLAIDLGDGVDSFGSAQYAWLKVNAVLFGWHHPTYMDEGGRGPHEPWHWEFGTTDDRGSGTSTPILVDGQPNSATPVGPVAPESPAQPAVEPPVVVAPTATPTAAPTPTESPAPSATPTASPAPTESPTDEPTPTPEPTATDVPTEAPTLQPSPTTSVTPTDPATP